MASAARATKRERSAGVRELSPALHERIAKALAETREALLADDPTIKDDPVLMRDLLDGESDAVDGIRGLIRASITCDEYADTAKAAAKVYRERATDCVSRAERFLGRKTRLREVAGELMQAAGIESLPEPDFSAWFQDAPRQLAAEPDPALVPDEFVKYRAEVDKTKLLAALREGREIEGAPPLTNSRTSLVVRTK